MRPTTLLLPKGHRIGMHHVTSPAGWPSSKHLSIGISTEISTRISIWHCKKAADRYDILWNIPEYKSATTL